MSDDSFTLNLDGVQAWSSAVILRSGNHPITVTSEEHKVPGKDGYGGDHRVVVLQLEAIGGDEPGAEVRDWVHITANTLGRIAQIYEAFGIDVPAGDFKWIPLKGRNAKVLVREVPARKEPSRMVSEVKSYQRLAGDDAVAAVTSAFDAEPIPGTTGADDDIPF